MENPSQIAVQLALQTLKERCHNFQQRLTELEKENISLRSQVKQSDHIFPPSDEIDKLKAIIIELNEQKTQLKNNVTMVAAENRHLWYRLMQLTQVNKSLGTHLYKIHDSLKCHGKSNMQSALSRSKTFTQEEGHVKLIPKNPIEYHDRLSLELEDISLKLISSIAKEKCELEMQCSQMSEIQGLEQMSSSFGFTYNDDNADDTLLDKFEEHINELKIIKDVLLKEKEKLSGKMEILASLEMRKICLECENNKKAFAKANDLNEDCFKGEDENHFLRQNKEQIKSDKLDEKKYGIKERDDVGMKERSDLELKEENDTEMEEIINMGKKEISYLFQKEKDEMRHKSLKEQNQESNSAQNSSQNKDRIFTELNKKSNVSQVKEQIEFENKKEDVSNQSIQSTVRNYNEVTLKQTKEWINLQKPTDEERKGDLCRNDSEKDLEELESLRKWEGVDTPPNIKYKLPTDVETVDKICPMCSETFSKSISFERFQRHVENHFISEHDTLLNFEIVDT